MRTVLLRICAGLFLISPFVLCLEAAQTATITVINLDGPGEGFNDPSPADPASAAGGNSEVTLGAQRLVAFQRAANIWGSLLSSTVEIRIDANFDPLPCTSVSATLGGAAPNSAHRDFAGAPLQNTWYPQALANNFAGVDVLPNVSDIGATFNSAIGTTCPFPRVWYYGLDANPPAGQLDFVSVVLHELGHGLGFTSLVSLATGARPLELDDVYSRNLEDHSTGKLYPEMTNAERVSASQNTGNLHWVGANVVAASGRLTGGVDPPGHVRMYAPNPQQPGSSVSHFDTALMPNELMEPFYTGPNHDVGLTYRAVPGPRLAGNASRDCRCRFTQQSVCSIRFFCHGICDHYQFGSRNGDRLWNSGDYKSSRRVYIPDHQSCHQRRHRQSEHTCKYC